MARPVTPPLVLPMWAGAPPGVTAPEAVTPFAHPVLADAEQQWIATAHDRTLHWWLSWWPLAVALLLGGRQAYQAFLQATETPPPLADVARAALRAATTAPPSRPRRVVPWPGAVPPTRRRTDRDPALWTPDATARVLPETEPVRPEAGRVTPPHGGPRVPLTVVPAIGPPPLGSAQRALRRPLSHRDRQAAWDLTAETAALRIVEWADGMRDDVRLRVVMAVRLRMTPAQLASDLEQRWGHTHANIARIAVTELTSAYVGAQLMRRPVGSWVWIPPIGDGKVCAWCKARLERHWFQTLPVAPTHPTGVEWGEWLWPAKSWQTPDGRRVPALPAHPWCRHTFEGGVIAAQGGTGHG